MANKAVQALYSAVVHPTVYACANLHATAVIVLLQA